MPIGNRIANAFVQIGDRLSRASALRSYAEMSDAELARKGLRRDQIVSYVYRDIKNI